MAQTNLSELYSSIALDVFRATSVTANVPFNDDYQWDGTRTIKVYTPGTTFTVDYGDNPIARYGIPSELPNTQQALMLTQDKAYTFLVPRAMDDNTMFMDDLGKATARTISEVQVPEIDKYRIDKLAANAGETKVTEATASNAYSLFLEAQEFLSDNETPAENRFAFVSNSYFTKLKLASDFVVASDTGQNMKITGYIGMVDGIPIISVPKPRLPANQQFILFHSQAATCPIKFTELRVDDNSMNFREYHVVGSYLHDAFVFDARKNSIFSCVSS